MKRAYNNNICVAVDLTGTFDTVNYNVLLSKIARSTLSEATCRWLSYYIRGRQSVTNCRSVKSKARIVHTGVPQGIGSQNTGSKSQSQYLLGSNDSRGETAQQKILHLANWSQLIHPGPVSSRPIFLESLLNRTATTSTTVTSFDNGLHHEKQKQHLLDGDDPFLTGQLAVDISTKVISNLIHARPSTIQYPPEDQDRRLRTSPTQNIPFATVLFTVCSAVTVECCV